MCTASRRVERRSWLSSRAWRAVLWEARRALAWVFAVAIWAVVVVVVKGVGSISGVVEDIFVMGGGRWGLLVGVGGGCTYWYFDDGGVSGQRLQRRSVGW